MSHAATNWAIQQRGLKPAAKIVLWHLCDCYNPENGSFPSQDYLAENCELSRSAINVHLDALEEAGLIARQQRRQRGSNRQERTRYSFAFEPGFAGLAAEKPCPETGHGQGAEPVSGNQGEPCPENEQSRVQNPDSNPVREPVTEPVNEREGRESADETRQAGSANRKAIERAFWALVKDWPEFAGMPKEPALAPWLQLTDAERELAARRFPAWLALLKAQKKSHVPAPSTYFRQKLWTEVADEPAKAAAPVQALPFGKAWMAMWIGETTKEGRPMPRPTVFVQADLDAGGERAIDAMIRRNEQYRWPKLGDMSRRHRERDPVRAPAEAVAAGADFVSVELAGPVGQAWKRLFRRMLVPWPPFDHSYAYFPPIASDAADLDQAVAAAFHQFRERTGTHVHAAAE